MDGQKWNKTTKVKVRNFPKTHHDKFNKNQDMKRKSSKIDKIVYRNMESFNETGNNTALTENVTIFNHKII